MLNYSITIITRKVLKTNVLYNSAYFNEDLSLDYGVHHFITTLGEVAVIDLLNEEEKWAVIDEISDIIKMAWESINKNSEHKNMRTSLQKDAWRYFADKSPKGKTWYLENILDPYLYEQVDTGKKIVELFQKVELDVSPVNITYNSWSSLSRDEKLKKANFFMLHPINGNKPIGDDDFGAYEKSI